MSKLLKLALLGLMHPSELRAVINWSIWRDPKQDITKMDESGYSRESMKRCWYFLDQTSRSFSAVIKELDGELCRVVCLFYLVLRGLDTIEDDMSLDLDLKEDLLVNFWQKLETPGWTFDGCGPNEKDRQLLVEFDKVIDELMMLDDSYKTVITRVCRSMGFGMAHYAREAAKSQSSYAVDTLKDFDLYCHYVAGLVGEGLSGLFSASGKESDELAKRLTLSNSMGMMLQKTNIMRDFREDLEDGRLFWPKEIWGKNTNDPKQFYTNPDMKQKALWAMSEMVLDALSHAVDCLDYLSLLKNQSIFNFCSIPQVMAIATLEICFMNPDVFEKNVKIRRSLALQLILRCSNAREVSQIFLTYARRIHKKADPADPSFLKLCVAVGQIEQWCENRYPSWLFTDDGKIKGIPAARDTPDAAGIPDARVRQLPVQDPQAVARAARLKQEQGMTTEDFKIILFFVLGILAFFLVMGGSIAGFIWYMTKDYPQTFFGSFYLAQESVTSAVKSAVSSASARVDL